MKETITIADSFESSILSPECGVKVTITITGSLKVITFPHRPVGPQDLTIANIRWVATAGNNQVRFRNVSMTLTRVEPDGTAILSTAGHQPVEFTGVTKINLDTGEVTLEPHHFADIPRLCELLTA